MGLNWRTFDDSERVWASDDECLRAENSQYVSGSWYRDGNAYHQVVTGPLTNDLLFKNDSAFDDWLAVHGRSLIHRRVFNRFGEENSTRRVCMVFTDLSEATHARLRWG